MPSYNKVILMGHLTRDPQTKVLPSQVSVTEFGMGINRKFKTAGGEDRQEVVFVDISVFGKTGEVIAQYFAKGKPIMVEGRLKLDQWEKDGHKRSKLSVIAERFEFVGGPKEGDDSDQRPAANYPRTRKDLATAPASPPYGNEQEFDPDSIPF